MILKYLFKRVAVITGSTTAPSASQATDMIQTGEQKSGWSYSTFSSTRSNLEAQNQQTFRYELPIDNSVEAFCLSRAWLILNNLFFESSVSNTPLYLTLVITALWNSSIRLYWTATSQSWMLTPVCCNAKRALNEIIVGKPKCGMWMSYAKCTPCTLCCVVSASLSHLTHIHRSTNKQKHKCPHSKVTE